MNTIRPLITITILVVVGAFLYVKINQGPAMHSAPGASDAWPSQAPEGVPPLAFTAGPAVQGTTAAPAWSADARSAAPPMATESSPDVTATATADLSAQQPPAVPPIPEIPDMTPAAQPTVPTAAALIPLPTDLPANIPTAQYPGEPAPNESATSVDVTASAAPPAATTNLAAEPVTPPAPTVEPPATPEEANEIDVASAGLSSPPLAGQQNPLRQAQAPAGSDRYGTGGDPTLPADIAAPASSPASFATSWPKIQAVLDRGELPQAHQLLSRWHDDPALTPTDAELVDKLLSQLAGTVVYSTQHQLEPPYVVKPGDTLETIARELNVPWQLLAKINGIPAADQVQPGQELKVVRGPFSAVVDIGRKQLTLMVDDRYAGKFPVTVPSAAAVTEGQWLVDEKSILPAASVTQSAYSPAPAVDRAIVLRGEPTAGQSAAGSTLTIASSETPANSAAGPPAIRVSPQDAEELSDILSIGSRVVIRR